MESLLSGICLDAMGYALRAMRSSRYQRKMAFDTCKMLVRPKFDTPGRCLRLSLHATSSRSDMEKVDARMRDLASVLYAIKWSH